MIDCVKIVIADGPKGSFVVYPDFRTICCKDVMIRGGRFYAYWDEEAGLWSRDLQRLFETIDTETKKVCDELVAREPEAKVTTRYIGSFSSGILKNWNRFCKEMYDVYEPLDRKIIFAETQTTREDYATMRLPYRLEQGDTSAYDELVGTLYIPQERQKLEWAIGSIIAGDSKDIQKFLVLYGASGTGKSTMFDIMKMLFDGYCGTFSAKGIGDKNSSFALESLSDNPLLAIDGEGDLSRMDDNTRLNSITAHETTLINKKFMSQYAMRFDTMLFIGTNSPVKITDAKSGIIRRLIDVSPSGNLVSRNRYDILKSNIRNELGAIAYHCLQVYLDCGKNYYDTYKPTKMMVETNDIFNFLCDMLWEWEGLEFVTLANAWESYKKWCEDSGVPYPLKKSKFKAELLEYFDEFVDRKGPNTNCYIGLKTDKLNVDIKQDPMYVSWLSMKKRFSLLDDILRDCPAQYANEEGTPKVGWSNCKTTLHLLDTTKLHYVKVPQNHIVIDFDIKNEKGEKDKTLNLMAASKFPQTYAELSKSGCGIHLHYIYEGDVSELKPLYDKDIEVKVFNGDSSLRRQLTECNDISIAKLNGGLPKKEGDKHMIDVKSVENEQHLRNLIKKCLRKECNGHTVTEVQLMNKILSDAYSNDTVSYDIRDMKSAILSFAMASTHNSQEAYDQASRMHYCSKDHEEETKDEVPSTQEWDEAPIVFFDVEVFPNLFIICWKKIGENNKVVRMINPAANEVKDLFKFRLVGFNNRRYDNHIVYAASMGYNNEELYRLSQKIINKKDGCFFGEAYGISYTDIYDYCSNNNKMSLKKWQIKLGLFHLENQYPWDEPLDESHWEEVADYCCNDVISTEATWDATQSDFRARLILAELSGLTANDTTNTHTQQIIFGNDRHPQSQFNYPDLSEEFPGYEFKNGVSTYRGETVGEGGWVYAKPGMYYNAKCEDVSGMHPASVYAMMLFGREYTERYYDLVRVRTHIKHKEYDAVAEMFDGRLAKFLGSEEEAKELSNALKTAINSVYGLTAAHFPNRCRDPRNKDNVVAKRGALFMITLRDEVIKRGYEVIHCKTDSIKIANPDDYILKFIEDFGQKYGYTFEIEDVFDRLCLVNGSTFIALEDGKWKAKAAQFAHPFVFKTLFTHEDIEFKDMCEPKSTKVGSLYLDYNENLTDVTTEEKELKKLYSKWKKSDSTPEEELQEKELVDRIAEGHDYRFVGKVGLFTPVVEGANGGVLYSSADGVKYNSVSGTKGYRFYESAKILEESMQDKIDIGYFDNLCNDAIDNISQYGDFDIFVNGSHDEFKNYILTRDKEIEQ